MFLALTDVSGWEGWVYPSLFLIYDSLKSSKYLSQSFWLKWQNDFVVWGIFLLSLVLLRKIFLSFAIFIYFKISFHQEELMAPFWLDNASKCFPTQSKLKKW